jgi:putative membrane protein
MKFGVILAAILGLAVATGVVGYIGFGAVFSALSAIGWRGLGFLCLYAVLPFTLLGGAWYSLAPDLPVSQAKTFVFARMIRDSAGELLPFSQLGGFVIGARALVLRGIDPTLASSTTIVDVTTELIAQLGFTGLGVALLARRLGAGSTHDALVGAGLMGLLLSVLGALVLIAAQRRGAGLVERLAARWAPGMVERSRAVAAALDALYARPWRLMIAVALHLCAWVASAAGAWLALRLAGLPIRLESILAIESLVCAVRSATFIAPMGVGVQEASYAVVGPLFGLGPDMSLALSLLKRARDLAIGLPVLLVWQGLEGHRLLGRGHTREALTPDVE